MAMLSASDPLRQAWTREDDKLFERALLLYPEATPNRWEVIAAVLPGRRTAMEAWERYHMLLQDLEAIDRGLVETSNFWNNDGLPNEDAAAASVGMPSKAEQPSSMGQGSGGKLRRRPESWSEEEHKLFLYGLEKYGKGDWRSISRQVVKTKTATQVASHAQKYFLRQKQNAENGNCEPKRKSIHDIAYPSQL